MSSPAPAPLLLPETQRRLQALFGATEPVAIVPAAGSIALELTLRGAILHRAAVLVHRAAGERLARAAESLGREVARIVTADDLPVNPAEVDRFLDGPPLDAVLAELRVADGAPSLPLDAIGRAVRRRRGLVLVAEVSDAVGRIPLEMDHWGVDCCVAASEGALGLPAGLSLVAVSGRMLRRAAEVRGRGTTLDLAAHHAAAAAGRLAAPADPRRLQELEARLEAAVSSPRS